MFRNLKDGLVLCVVCAASAAAWLFMSPDETAWSAAAPAKAAPPKAAAAETAPTTFLELRKIESENGWGDVFVSKAEIAKLFQAERDRLGEKFGVELLKYLKGHSERHYWAGSFLTSEPYLGGREPDLPLALMVWENGIFHCLANAQDRNEQARVVSLSILSAIASAQLELPELAAAHKRRAVARGKNFGGTFPAIPDEERAIYDAIKVEPAPPPADTPKPANDAKDRSKDGL